MIQSPTDPNKAITFQDFQEFKLLIYGMVIVFLINVVTSLGKTLWSWFSKKQDTTDDILKKLVDQVGELKGDIREIKTQLENRPTKDEMLVKIYEKR